MAQAVRVSLGHVLYLSVYAHAMRMQDPMALLGYSKAAVEWLESVLLHRVSHGGAAFAGGGVAGGGGTAGGGGGAGEQPAALPLVKRASSVARAAPQENVHMRRVSQLASVAGLAEGPLLAAAGEADIALQDARLHRRHADCRRPHSSAPPSLGSATAQQPCFLGLARLALGVGRVMRAHSVLWRSARAAQCTVRRQMSGTGTCLD